MLRNTLTRLMPGAAELLRHHLRDDRRHAVAAGAACWPQPSRSCASWRR
ncbi:hypothetical protein KAF44_33920 [Cupriavidus necator]|nr:hypothetical protein KAF44_33920 [Cupriavidus necator]